MLGVTLEVKSASLSMYERVSIYDEMVSIYDERVSIYERVSTHTIEMNRSWLYLHFLMPFGGGGGGIQPQVLLNNGIFN